MANINMGTTHDFTPSDSTVDTFNMLIVTGATGDVVIDQQGGNEITLTAVPVGVWIPVGRAIRIKATGTTATGFLVV